MDKFGDVGGDDDVKLMMFLNVLILVQSVIIKVFMKLAVLMTFVMTVMFILLR